jgi:hypothetical protein
MKKKAAGFVFLFLILSVLFSFSGCSGTKGATGPMGAAGGYVMQFQDGLYPAASYAGCGAVGLDALDLTTNYYGYEPFNVGSFTGDHSRFLLKFDLTSVIPSNIKVTKAYITINITATVGSNAYAFYPMTRNFLPNAANWSTSNGVAAWTTNGGDFSSTAVSENFYVQAGANGKLTYTLDPALVQGWIADYTTNNGVILKATFENTGDNYITMNTDQCPTFSQRPMLTVYYTLP